MLCRACGLAHVGCFPLHATNRCGVPVIELQPLQLTAMHCCRFCNQVAAAAYRNMALAPVMDNAPVCSSTAVVLLRACRNQDCTVQPHISCCYHSTWSAAAECIAASDQQPYGALPHLDMCSSISSGSSGCTWMQAKFETAATDNSTHQVRKKLHDMKVESGSIAGLQLAVI